MYMMYLQINLKLLNLLIIQLFILSNQVILTRPLNSKELYYHYIY